MDLGKTSELIIRAIEEIWDAGIVLSQEALFFLESGFGITTPPELERAMTQEDFQEWETVVEYLLFPELHMLSDLESLLGPGGLSTEAAQGIAGRLSQNHSRLNFLYPEDPVPVSVQISQGQVSTFVARLNLTGKIEADICIALEETAAPEDVPGFRVLLRNRDCQFRGHKKRFLLEFMEKAMGRPGEFGRVFELFLILLSQAPDSMDPAAYFLERAQGEREMIKRIRKFEEKLSRYNMEYLMLSKYPVPPESIYRVAQRLEKLTLIIEEILCIPHFQAVEPPDRDLGRFDPDRDMGKLMDIL